MSEILPGDFAGVIRLANSMYKDLKAGACDKPVAIVDCKPGAKYDCVRLAGHAGACDALLPDYLPSDFATILRSLLTTVEYLKGQNQRLSDLVRHQRGALYDAELITDEEYAALVEDPGAVSRLETIDELREKIRGAALSEVWIFGAFGGTGHFLRTMNCGRVAFPAAVVAAVDGALACPLSMQREGSIVTLADAAKEKLHALGFSYVAWWDRQGDIRAGSYTGVLARGTWTPQQLVEAARRLAPWAIRVTPLVTP